MTRPLDVLIVDDDRNMRATLAEILIGDGFDVRAAACGEEAVELCRHHRFRMILIDVRMPGLDGLETYRRIREGCSRSQIALMSAYVQPELERRAIDDGVFAVLRKPLDVEAILKLIAEVTSTALLCVGLSAESAAAVQRGVAQGFRLTCVETPEQAVRLSRQIHYDALLLDVDAVGIDSAPHRRVRDAFATEPMLLLHGDGMPAEAARRAAIDGAYATLSKPLQVEALLGLLEQIKRQRLGTAPSAGDAGS